MGSSIKWFPPFFYIFSFAEGEDNIVSGWIGVKGREGKLKNIFLKKEIICLFLLLFLGGERYLCLCDVLCCCVLK